MDVDAEEAWITVPERRPDNIVITVPITEAVSYTHLRAPRDLSTSRMPSSA